MYLFALLTLLAITLIDLANVIRGGEVKNGLFGLIVRAIGGVATLALLMVAVAVAIVLAGVGGALFLVVLAGAYVLDLITSLYRKVKFSGWLTRLRARGKSAEDRLELANAVAEGRRPIYGRVARKAAGERRTARVNKDGGIDVTR